VNAIRAQNAQVSAGSLGATPAVKGQILNASIMGQSRLQRPEQFGDILLRATLIPTIAVPVVLLGTFGVIAVAGLSINTLTLFGLVLAIGLLVDDAIVVVENVERVMEEEGLSPRDATRKSMDQISGALIGIAMVLCAAFVPMAFFSGSTGVIYRQFLLTITAAVALSVLVALILTPALCATLLKPVPNLVPSDWTVSDLPPVILNSFSRPRR
jgi:multidrug efflux pump subunit AcrB